MRALCCERNASTGTMRVHLNGGCRQRAQGAWALCSHDAHCEYPDASRTERAGRCACAVPATGERVYSKLYARRDSDVSTPPSSTRNCRIEHLWGEVGSQFARRWHAFFTQLEVLHRLDSNNAVHLWLLHVLFLDDIDCDCQMFRQEWNCHLISGPDTNYKSPMVSAYWYHNSSAI